MKGFPKVLLGTCNGTDKRKKMKLEEEGTKKKKGGLDAGVKRGRNRKNSLSSSLYPAPEARGKV